MSSRVKEGGLKFSYAYREGEGATAKLAWKNSWRKPQIPAGVKVELILAGIKPTDPPIIFQKQIFIPTGSWGK